MKPSISEGGGLSKSVHILTLSGYGSEVMLGTGRVMCASAGLQMRRGGETQSSPAGGIVTNVMDSASKKAEQLISRMLREHFLKPPSNAPVRVGQQVLDECMGFLETGLLRYRNTVRQNESNPPVSFCTLECGRLAGVLYDRLDRTRMLALLEECEKRTGRPAGVTNQWFLATLLQKRVSKGSAAMWMRRLNVVPDGVPFSNVLLYGDQVGNHFVGLDAMSAPETLRLDVISRLFNLFLKTKRGPKLYLDFDRRVRKTPFKTLNTFGIELAAYLHRTLGRKWFGVVVQVARLLFDHPEAYRLSDPCFLGCFLRLLNAYLNRGAECFCKHLQLPYRQWQTGVYVEAASEGDDFFGRLPDLNRATVPVNVEPVNLEPINVEPINVEPINVEPINVEPVNAERAEVSEAERAEVSEAEQLVANAMHAHFLQAKDTTLPGSMPEPALRKVMEWLEHIIGRTLRKSERHGSEQWDLPVSLRLDYVRSVWAWVAGVLYDRLDRARVLKLIEKSGKRPKGVSNQWFFAALLQKSVGSVANILPWVRMLNLPCDNWIFSNLKLYADNAAQHFSCLPASEAERACTASLFLHMLLEANRNPDRRASLRQMFQRPIEWINPVDIELTAFLYNRLGGGACDHLARVSRQFWGSPNTTCLSDPCFLGCVLGVIRCCTPYRLQQLCRPLNFQYNKDKKCPSTCTALEGPDFFGRLPGYNFQPPIPQPREASIAPTLLKAPFAASSLTKPTSSAPSSFPEDVARLWLAPSTTTLASVAHQEAYDREVYDPGASRNMSSQAVDRQELPGKKQPDFGPVSDQPLNLCRRPALIEGDESTCRKKRKL